MGGHLRSSFLGVYRGDPGDGTRSDWHPTGPVSSLLEELDG
jgi:hypothetical protein